MNAVLRKRGLVGFKTNGGAWFRQGRPPEGMFFSQTEPDRTRSFVLGMFWSGMTDRLANWRMPSPKQMEKLAVQAARGPAPSAAAPDAPLPAEYWESVLNDPRASTTGAQMRLRLLSEVQRHVLRVSCRRCERTVEIQTADAVRLYGGKAVWKDVAQRLLDNTCQQRTGRHEEDGCGRRSRRRSPLRIADPITLRLDVRMAPKYHPTPLSGGDRKALAKELGKARAMANILAAQAAEMRAKGEAIIQQADRLLCESWNERMERWRTDRSLTHPRPGHQRRLSLAGNPLFTLQDAERRRPCGDEAPADHLRPRSRQPAAVPQMRQGGAASLRDLAPTWRQPRHPRAEV
jgi:hypothetical protein